MSEQQFRVIITSHDSLCVGYLKAAQLILGVEFPNVSTLPFEASSSMSDFEDAMRKMVEQKPLRPLLILCDLMGGTPANVATKFMLINKQIKVVVGVNLPFILEILLHQDSGASLLDIPLDDVILSAKNSVIDIRSLMKGCTMND